MSLYFRLTGLLWRHNFGFRVKPTPKMTSANLKHPRLHLDYVTCNDERSKNWLSKILFKTNKTIYSKNKFTCAVWKGAIRERKKFPLMSRYQCTETGEWVIRVPSIICTSHWDGQNVENSTPCLVRPVLIYVVYGVIFNPHLYSFQWSYETILRDPF